MAGGIVTAAPLVLFMYGARHLRLSTLGLMQYTAPTCQFALAVLLYGEPVTGPYTIALGCIWLALALYAADTGRRSRPQA